MCRKNKPGTQFHHHLLGNVQGEEDNLSVKESLSNPYSITSARKCRVEISCIRLGSSCAGLMVSPYQLIEVVNLRRFPEKTIPKLFCASKGEDIEDGKGLFQMLGRCLVVFCGRLPF